MIIPQSARKLADSSLYKGSQKGFDYKKEEVEC